MRHTLSARVGIILLLLLALQGCGRKGPLYLPKEMHSSAVFSFVFSRS